MSVYIVTNPNPIIEVFSATILTDIGPFPSPTISERGVVYSTSPNPTTSDTTVIDSGTTSATYTTNITGLAEATTYYVRSYLIDTDVTYYSQEIQFTTRTIAFEQVNTPEIKGTSATVSATINANLGLNITERGFVYSTSPNPSITSNPIVVEGTEAGEFSSEITGLELETEYFFRAYIKYTNSPEVTFLSGVLSFTTTPPVLIPKTYFYKFFDFQGNYQESFKERGFNVSNLPDFNWRINGGKGMMRVNFDANIEEFTDWIKTNTVAVMQCVVHDSETPEKGEVIYSGLASDSKYQLKANGHISLDGFAYSSAEGDLNNKRLQTIGGETRVSYSNMDFADIYKDIIDKYQLLGGYVFYTSSSVDTVGINLSITFKNESVLEAMQRLAGFLPRGWFWRIDGANKFELKQTNFSVPDHRVWIGREVSEGDVTLSIADVKNDVLFHGGETGTGKLYRRKSLLSSIQTYGIRSEALADERVVTVDTAELRMDNLLNQKSVAPRYIEFVIQDGNLNRAGYDIESLKVGDSIQVLHPSVSTDFTRYQNPAGTVGNAVYNESFYNYNRDASLGVPFQIQEIRYQGNQAIVRSSDILQNQSQTIRQLQKSLLTQSTVDSPDAPN
jgi:hypothetical protein